MRTIFSASRCIRQISRRPSVSSCSLPFLISRSITGTKTQFLLSNGVLPSFSSSCSAFPLSLVRRYRREPIREMSELDLEEEVAKIDMDPKKLLQKGDPNSMQAIIKDVMPVGYILSLPTGRDAYLPADDFGFTGGLSILQRLFKEGQEITVRIVCRGGAGREIVSCKKPEFAPASEQKTIESMRLHFEWEKKNRMNPRRRHSSY